MLGGDARDQIGGAALWYGIVQLTLKAAGFTSGEAPNWDPRWIFWAATGTGLFLAEWVGVDGVGVRYHG